MSHFIVRRFSLLTAICLGVAACQSGSLIEDDPARRVELAREAFAQAAAADQQAEPEAALQYMRLASSLRPKHPTILLNLAVMELEAGDPERARLILRRLAQMGVGRDLLDSAQFAGHADNPEFRPILEQLRSQTEPVGESELFFRASDVPMPFLPEGLAYDSDRNWWYLSGVAAGAIRAFQVDGSGASKPVFGASTPRAMKGMAYDSKHTSLWVAASTMVGFHDEPVAAWLYRYHHDAQAGKSTFTEAQIPGDAPAHADDVLLLGENQILVSDGERGTVWSFPLDVAGHVIADEVSPWLQGPNLPSPQGLATARGYVYLADYSTGLHRLDAETGRRLSFDLVHDLCDLGIDGLSATGDGRLIAIQNGFAPQRIIELTLSNDGSSVVAWRVLAAGLPEWNEPTLGLVQGEYFYFVANSHWPDFANPSQPAPNQTLPEVHRIRL